VLLLLLGEKEARGKRKEKSKEKKKINLEEKMLVPSDMMAAQSKMLYQLNKYYGERVQGRKGQIAKTLREVCKVVQDVLKEVEVQEPRFISSLAECNGRFDGLEVVSPNEFEVVLYLNQMGVFNFVDDGTLPGCAVLKLSDGRKRSMSLWVEFITASGYLSARKIRSRFQTLVAQVSSNHDPTVNYHLHSISLSLSLSN